MRWIWLAIAVIYGAFFYWYTSFGGPLTDEEIERYMSSFENQSPAPSPELLARFRAFMESDTGDDFVMLNVIDLYDTPRQIEGVEPGQTSTEVVGKYMEYMYPALLSRACHPVMAGRATSDALEVFNAPGMEVWDQGALMRYRSRRDLLEIASNPGFQGPHEFKEAAMAKTIAFPLDPWFQLGDPRLVLALLLLALGFGASLVAARR